MCIQGLGCVCYIRVDGTAYTLWGQLIRPKSEAGDVKKGSLISTEVTPTRTIQTIQVGPMNVTVTFLSPVEVVWLYPLQFPSPQRTDCSGSHPTYYGNRFHFPTLR